MEMTEQDKKAMEIAKRTMAMALDKFEAVSRVKHEKGPVEAIILADSALGELADAYRPLIDELLTQPEMVQWIANNIAKDAWKAVMQTALKTALRGKSDKYMLDGARRILRQSPEEIVAEMERRHENNGDDDSDFNSMSV